MDSLTLRPTLGSEEYPALVGMWRRSVDATHAFLKTSDRDEIESHLASDYFPAVTITVAQYDDRPVGFSGVLDGTLEMLFVDADQRGHGVGTALLDHAIREQDVNRVDVNEQNTQALNFYLHHGFTVVGRSDRDDADETTPSCILC